MWETVEIYLWRVISIREVRVTWFAQGTVFHLWYNIQSDRSSPTGASPNWNYFQVVILFKSGLLIHWVPLPMSWSLDLLTVSCQSSSSRIWPQVRCSCKYPPVFSILLQRLPDSQSPLRAQSPSPFFPFPCSRWEWVFIRLQSPCSRLRW